MRSGGYAALAGVLIAGALLLAFSIPLLPSSLSPPTYGSKSPAASISCPDEPPFVAYYVGGTFGDLPLEEATTACTAGGVAGSVTFLYGDYTDTPEGSRSGEYPLEVRSMPLCDGFVQDERNLDLLTDGRNPQLDAYVRTRALGVPAVRLSDGQEGDEEHVSFELYTGHTVISISGSSRHHVERAIRALRRAPGKYVPFEGSGSLTEFEAVPAPPVRQLRAPPPGLFEGKVCTRIAEERERRLERKRKGTRRQARQRQP